MIENVLYGLVYVAFMLAFLFPPFPPISLHFSPFPPISLHFPHFPTIFAFSYFPSPLRLVG